MKLLRSGVLLDSFFNQLSQSPHSLLMLDYDGTLAPFTPQRDHAFPYPFVKELVPQIMVQPGAEVAVISGRTVADLIRLVDVRPPPIMWGSHGMERRDADGSFNSRELPKGASELLTSVRTWAESAQLVDKMENKPAGLAFHWRGLAPEDADDMKDMILSEWSEVVARSPLDLHEFDGGLEFRLAGISKADAVNEALRDADTSTLCAYLGDDLTDEDAFQALGARGLRVLVRPEFRETVADLWITPPDELLMFFTRWLTAVRR